MRKKLTAKFVETVKCEGPRRLEFYDLSLPAFGLRVSYSGVKTWFCVKRVNHRVRRISLGKYPAMSLSTAHDAARIVLQEFEHQPEVDCQTLGQVVPQFIALHAKPKNRNWQETERLLNQKFRSLFDRPLRRIARSDIVKILDRVVLTEKDSQSDWTI